MEGGMEGADQGNSILAPILGHELYGGMRLTEASQEVASWSSGGTSDYVLFALNVQADIPPCLGC